MAERGLLLPTKSQLTACENAMTVSSSDLPPASFPGWEAVAKQYAKILLAELAVELQDKNDCQGNALATGEEARQRLSTGAMRQFARTYAYNASEAIDTGMRSVGADRGSTITAGVQLLTKGCHRSEFRQACRLRPIGNTTPMSGRFHDLPSGPKGL
jgi:hypothetical protein